MVAKAKTITVQLRIKCLHPPQGTCNGESAQFGLQDKAQKLQTGQPQPHETLQFECTVEVIDGQPPNFKGTYVHGTPTTRFLYLSLGCQQGDKWHWIRRIKIPLMSLTWQQLEAAVASKGILEAVIDGYRTGTVKLTEKDWKIAEV